MSGIKQKTGRTNKPKGLDEILYEKIESAVVEYERKNSSLFASAFSAGLEIGFSFFLIGLVYSMYHDIVSEPTMHFMMALAYPIGFIFVIIGRAQLFTEHTTLAVLPVLERRQSLMSMFQLWAIILAGNLLGGFLFSFVLAYFVPQMGIISQETFAKIAFKIIDYPTEIILGSAILAGWLMGLLSWLLASAQETTSRIFVIILVTATIGLGHLHHSIVGSIEVFTGYLLSPKISFLDYLSFEITSIIGNAIGGVFFVGAVKYSQKSSD